MRRKVKIWLEVAALVILSFVLVIAIVLQTGAVDRWARGAIVGQLEQMTGGKAELGAFRFSLWSLRAELENLVIHGREPEGTPPFFRAEYMLVDLHLVSLFGRQIRLDELHIHRPAVHVRFDEEGRSNAPSPAPRAESHSPAGTPQASPAASPAATPPKGSSPDAAPSSATPPAVQRLFDLRIGRVRLTEGYILYNDVRVPLVAEGEEFNFTFQYQPGEPGADYYSGEMSWEQMRLVARRYLPFASDVALRFRLGRERFDVDELRWKLPHSAFRVTAAAAPLAAPELTAEYDGTLDLQDLRDILRKPNSPLGKVDLAGRVGRAGGKTTLDGRYRARDLSLHFTWFHSAGIESAGRYHLADGRILMPEFTARALGGQVRGDLEFRFEGQRFRVNSQARGMSVAQVLAAVDNPKMPVGALHWNGSLDVDSVTTWERDFKSVDSRGLSLWSPPVAPAEGEIPVTARLDYHYVMDLDQVELRRSEISTPTARLTFDGRLGAEDSALLADFRTSDLAPWNDFIHRLRGPEAEPVPIRGEAHWQGRVTGRLSRPTMAGRVTAQRIAYGALYWDQVAGDVSYSPDEVRLDRGVARRGASAADVAVALELTDWSFRPENQWHAEVNLVSAPTAGLQQLLGTSYPVEGLVTGQFRGRGTRADPELVGLVDVAEVKAWGLEFERARGQVSARRDEVRVANAELRVGTGRITGNLLYRMEAAETEFDVTGAVVPIERLGAIQTERLPLGGQLSFQLRGQGRLAAPRVEGSVRAVELRVGEHTLGSIQANLRSDGRRVTMDLESAMTEGSLSGKVEIALGGDYPVRGDLTARNLDLDVFIQTALRLRGGMTGHSQADGRFRIEGALLRPETVAIDADVSRLLFDYQYLKLENVGPLQVRYSREEVRITQARIRGPDTDFTITGFARFGGDRAVNLRMDGSVDLRLAGGFLPELAAQGVARVNGAVEGTLSQPRITGRAVLEDATANYGELPTGLSRIRGAFVFDRNRLLFENVTAEAGGGRLVMEGTVSYGEGPFRYDIQGNATRVRVRYPEGMSWLASGRLRLSGTPEASLLSGRVTVERLLMAEGFDITAVFFDTQPAAPRTSSEFLRNLQFDIEAVSSPDARVEWQRARFESEASLRVRGTWEHPILLGHIHLLGGEMAFRGNRYRLIRGDINFSRPLSLEPDLDIEAVTRVRQYEVTLNVSGRASQLALSYRSDPPLPASDVLVLLALGRTGEETELRTATQQQQPELGATALISEAIASQVGGRIERLFGISRFRVDPFLAGTGSEQNATARITIEQQLTRDLVITYVTNVTSTQQQIIQVEYNVTRDISIIGLRDQNGTFGLDFKRTMRFR